LTARQPAGCPSVFVTFGNGNSCFGPSETVIDDAARHAAIPARRNNIFFFMGELHQSERTTVHWSAIRGQAHYRGHCDLGVAMAGCRARAIALRFASLRSFSIFVMTIPLVTRKCNHSPTACDPPGTERKGLRGGADRVTSSFDRQQPPCLSTRRSFDRHPAGTAKVPRDTSGHEEPFPRIARADRTLSFGMDPVIAESVRHAVLVCAHRVQPGLS
jgi:hypothetical protein